MNKKMPKNSRLDLFPNLKRYSNVNSFKATELYNEIAMKHGISLTDLSLSFVNDRPFVTSNIIGATSISQLKEKYRKCKCEIEPEIIKEINSVNELIPNPAQKYFTTSLTLESFLTLIFVELKSCFISLEI